jgi:hypothetical protein
MAFGEKADGNGNGFRFRVAAKKRKVRIERRRAKRDPECMPGYGFYNGWLT